MRWLLLALLAACKNTGGPPPAPAAAPVVEAPPAPTSCAVSPHEAMPGITVERVTVGDGDACLSLVRVDLARWSIQAHSANREGRAWQTAPAWGALHHLGAVVNASMYAEDGDSVTLLTGNNPRDNPRFGGFMAWDPVDPRVDPPLVVTGRDCPGFDLERLRKRYRGLVQDYRLLGCQGEALPWKDQKIYSAAGVGVDRHGHLVLMHCRAAFAMATLSARLADPGLELAGLLYVEGGPEASVWVAGPPEVALIGSFESGFFDDSNDHFWPLPNVIGVAPRR